MNQKMIEFIREKVIMAAHPECITMNEAVEKDKINCCYRISVGILPRPIQLSLILNAINKNDLNFIVSKDIENSLEFSNLKIKRDFSIESIFMFNWIILRKNGEYAILEDQSEETIKTIAMLLGWDNEN